MTRKCGDTLMDFSIFFPPDIEKNSCDVRFFFCFCMFFDNFAFNNRNRQLINFAELVIKKHGGIT